MADRCCCNALLVRTSIFSLFQYHSDDCGDSIKADNKLSWKISAAKSRSLNSLFAIGSVFNSGLFCSIRLSANTSPTACLNWSPLGQTATMSNSSKYVVTSFFATSISSTFSVKQKISLC